MLVQKKNKKVLQGGGGGGNGSSSRAHSSKLDCKMNGDFTSRRTVTRMLQWNYTIPGTMDGSL